MHSCEALAGASAPSPPANGPSLLVQLGRLIVRSRSPSIDRRQSKCSPSTSHQIVTQPRPDEPTPALEAALTSHVQALWTEQIPICIEVLLAPDCLDCYRCLSRVDAEAAYDKTHSQQKGLLLERWTMTALTNKGHESQAFITSQWLLNAVRSQLHFSQLSAWRQRLQGAERPHPRRKLSREKCNIKKMESNCDDVSEFERNLNVIYSIKIPGESYRVSEFSRQPTDHVFPLTDIGNNVYLKVNLESLPRIEEIPIVKCFCRRPSISEELVGKLNDLSLTSKFDINTNVGPSLSSRRLSIISNAETNEYLFSTNDDSKRGNEIENIVDDRMHTLCSENGKHKCNCDDESDFLNQKEKETKKIDERRLKEIAKYKRRLRKESKLKKLSDSTSSEGEQKRETHTSIPILQAARFDRFRAIGCYRNQTYLTLPASRIETRSPFIDHQTIPQEYKRTASISTQTDDLECQCGVKINFKCDNCRTLVRSEANYNLSSMAKDINNCDLSITKGVTVESNGEKFHMIGENSNGERLNKYGENSNSSNGERINVNDESSNGNGQRSHGDGEIGERFNTSGESSNGNRIRSHDSREKSNNERFKTYGEMSNDIVETSNGNGERSHGNGETYNAGSERSANGETSDESGENINVNEENVDEDMEKLKCDNNSSNKTCDIVIRDISVVEGSCKKDFNINKEEYIIKRPKVRRIFPISDRIGRIVSDRNKEDKDIEELNLMDDDTVFSTPKSDFPRSQYNMEKITTKNEYLGNTPSQYPGKSYINVNYDRKLGKTAFNPDKVNPTQHSHVHNNDENPGKSAFDPDKTNPSKYINPGFDILERSTLKLKPGKSLIPEFTELKKPEPKRQKTFSINDDDFISYEKCDLGPLDHCEIESPNDFDQNCFKFPDFKDEIPKSDAEACDMDLIREFDRNSFKQGFSPKSSNKACDKTFPRDYDYDGVFEKKLSPKSEAKRLCLYEIQNTNSQNQTASTSRRKRLENLRNWGNAGYYYPDNTQNQSLESQNINCQSSQFRKINFPGPTPLLPSPLTSNLNQNQNQSFNNKNESPDQRNLGIKSLYPDPNQNPGLKNEIPGQNQSLSTRNEIGQSQNPDHFNGKAGQSIPGDEKPCQTQNPGVKNENPDQSQNLDSKYSMDTQDSEPGERNDAQNHNLGTENQVPSPSEMDRFRWRFDSAASMVFHSRTGLPLTSSPAPLRRGNNCFGFDDSINGISGIKSALFHPYTPPPAPVSPPAVLKEEPAPKEDTPKLRIGPSTGLLGTFEESALKGRLEPVATVAGFTASLGASGSFCPPHKKLPVTVFFYAGPTSAPYLAHINLGSGYRVPRSGTVQVSLFNPHGTLVKMFVVLFDLTCMPACARTFLRQRTVYMPARAPPSDVSSNNKWLRYLIHLRFMTSKSGKLYLHTDIRILVSRKADLDTATAHSALFRPTNQNQGKDNKTQNEEHPTNHKAPNSNNSTNDRASNSRQPNRVFGGCSEFDFEQNGGSQQNGAKSPEISYDNQGVSYELRSFTYAPDNPRFSPR